MVRACAASHSRLPIYQHPAPVAAACSDAGIKRADNFHPFLGRNARSALRRRRVSEWRDLFSAFFARLPSSSNNYYCRARLAVCLVGAQTSIADGWTDGAGLRIISVRERRCSRDL
jgi:hypothetical protein